MSGFAAAIVVANSDTLISAASLEVAKSNVLFWCNTHQRRAIGLSGCDPRLGGIMMPCQCVELTGIAEIVEA